MTANVSMLTYQEPGSKSVTLWRHIRLTIYDNDEDDDDDDEVHTI